MWGRLAVAVVCCVAPFAIAEGQEQYKYEFKYGPDQYNYDVEGYGDEGYASGNVDTDGKYVEGYIVNEDGEEVRFEGEFTDYGRIEGYDEEGNYYELEAE